MDPVTIGMIIPAFVKRNESISLALSSDMILVFVMFSDMMQLADVDADADADE
jgi:glycerol-3-phosphate responsive antiterminator